MMWGETEITTAITVPAMKLADGQRDVRWEPVPGNILKSLCLWCKPIRESRKLLEHINTGQRLLMAKIFSPPFLPGNFKEIVDFRVFGDRAR
jgi:hypothetical protein